jgi:hypothetical protein
VKARPISKTEGERTEKGFSPEAVKESTDVLSKRSALFEQRKCGYFI